MCGLERLQLAHQRVERFVGDLRRGLNVIELFVPADFLAERLDLLVRPHTKSATEAQRHRASRDVAM